MADDDLVVRAELLDGVSGPARRAEASVDRLAASARRAGAATGGQGTSGVLQMATAGDRLSKIAGQADSSLVRMSNTITGKLVSGLKVAALGFGVAAVAAVGFGVKTAATFEQQRIQLEGLTGSAEAASKVFDSITALDPHTPFDRMQLTQATTQLASAGLAGDKLTAALQGVSDVASSAGGGSEQISRIGLAISQITAAGTVQMQDLNQLVQAGVNVGPALVKASGMSLAEFRKRGPGAGVQSQAFLDAIFGMDAGFSERASQTLTGRLSSVRSRVMMSLSSETAPLNQALKGALPAIEGGVGILLDQVFPPLAGIATVLLNLLVKGLPFVVPVVKAVAEGLGRLVTAAGPAMAGLGPLSGQLGKGISGFFTALVPLMPDIVRLLVNVIALLPDMIKLLGGLVILADPALKLVNALLGFGPLQPIFAGLVVALLGYSKLSTVFKTMRTFAEALGLIAAKQTAVNVANTGAGEGGAGMAGAVGGKALPLLAAVPLAGMAVQGALSKDKSAGNALSTIASAAGAGALVGSVVPGIGTGIGALGAGAVATGVQLAKHLWGDTAHPFTGGMGGLPGAAGLSVTSGQRNWGLGGLGSDHATGRAVDLIGPNLNEYAQTVRAMGGFAEFHGDGGARHLHAVGDTPRPRPSGTGTLGGDAPIVVNVTFGDIYTQSPGDMEEEARRGLARALRESNERGGIAGLRAGLRAGLAG